MFFLTVVTHQRRGILCQGASRILLRAALDDVCRLRPFALRAIVLMPDHLHTIWALPPGDADFSLRLGLVKKRFTRAYLAAGGAEGPATPSRLKHRIRGVWEKRFYEHTIRDYRDFKLHLDYIHFNPVKHGLVGHARDWPWSTFHAYMAKGEYDEDWAGNVQYPGGTDIEPDNW